MKEDNITYEEQMLNLQKEANKRLKGIDNTLDWFFWIMIIGIVLFFVSIFFSATI